MLRDIRADAAFYRTLRSTSGGLRFGSATATLLLSRGLLLLVVGRTCRAHDAWRPRRRSERLLHLFTRVTLNVTNRMCQMITKGEVQGSVEGGVYLSDGGHIFLGVRHMGAGTVVHDHVTIGRGAKPGDVPEVGRDVWIGPGCVLYGKIRVGDGVTLLPRTVLSGSVPPRVVVAGNPGHVVRRDFDNTELRSTASSDVTALLRTDPQR